jgi:hypothetical protein
MGSVVLHRTVTASIPHGWEEMNRPTFTRRLSVSASERQRELRRRRHRRKKLEIFNRKLAKATVSEKAVIAEKIRSLTPGGDIIVERLDLEKR